MGVYFLSIRLRRFSRIGSELRDMADQFNALADGETRTARQLNNYASIFEELEADFNMSWQIGGWLGLVLALGVASSYVPLFDSAVSRAAKGGYRRERPRQAERIACGASLFGAYVSIALLTFIVFSFVLAVCAMMLINDDIRAWLWSYRNLAYSYAISYVLKTYILQPTIFHYYATDGFLIKRDVLFYICNIAWIAYGVFVGATVALIRVGMYIGFSILATGDLGICILPESLKVFDFAHMAYVAQVLFHNHHHNTVAHVFADALASSCPRRRLDEKTVVESSSSSSSEESSSEDSSSSSKAADAKDDGSSPELEEEEETPIPVRRRRRRARNRWLIAYTLIHNPQLRLDRRRRSIESR